MADSISVPFRELYIQRPSDVLRALHSRRAETSSTANTSLSPPHPMPSSRFPQTSPSSSASSSSSPLLPPDRPDTTPSPLPFPTAEATCEARAEYGVRLLEGLRQLDTWLRYTQPPLSSVCDVLANTETYMADCAAHYEAWWCAVWRFGDQFCPPTVGSGRGQKTSYQTLVFLACLQLRLHVRRTKIAAGQAPDWDADEQPRDFAWLLRHGLVLNKDGNIGRLSLTQLNQALYTLLLSGWRTSVYHVEMRLYAERLLDRMAFLLLHIHPADVLDNAGYCQRVGQYREQQQHWEANGMSGTAERTPTGGGDDQYSLRHAADRAARSRFTFYAVNFDCIYHCQLRYWKMTRALHVESLLRRAMPAPRLSAEVRSHFVPDVGTLRVLIQHRAGRLHPIFSAQIAVYFGQHIVSPEDEPWLAYLSPTANMDGTSIIEELHEPIAARLIAESRRPIVEWIAEQGTERIAFVEYAVLQVFGQLLPPEADFFDHFVIVDEEFEHRLQGLTHTTRPRFVQIFSRFHIVYNQVVIERPTIYDAIVLWLQIIVVDFPTSRLWRDCMAPFWREKLGHQDETTPDIVFM